MYDLYDLYDLHLPGRADLFPVLYDLAHVAGWEPYSLHELANVSWVGSVLVCRSCTTSDSGRLGVPRCERVVTKKEISKT